MTRAGATPCEPTRPATVVALVRDRVLRARLTEGVRRLAAIAYCERAADVWPAVEAAAGGGRPVRACILEPRDADGVPLDALVESLRRRVPAMPVLAYCSPERTRSADLLAMARAGVSGVLLAGYDDVGAALRGALAAAADDAAARRMLDVLRPGLPRHGRVLVEHCLRHGRDPLAVADVARALGVDRKTLSARLAAAGLPEPRRVIGWARLCLVVHALEARGGSIERTALDFGYPSASALRNLCKRYTGSRLTELRAAGGLAHVLRLFRGVLLSEADGPDGRWSVAGPRGRAAPTAS